VIGTVGRLVPQKGHRYLIDAMPMILKAVPKARLLIVGRGGLQAQLEEQVSGLALSRHVRLAGRRRDIPRLLAAMDVFAFPSLWEGFGIALLEAMTMELPVVASDVDGIPEVVQDRITGILVPPRSSVPLAEALIALLNRQALARAMGKRGKERVLAHFTIDQYWRKLDELYQSLLRR